MDEGRRRRFNLWGWALFMVSALFFVLTSLRHGDLLGGLFFFVACVVFIIPLLADRR